MCAAVKLIPVFAALVVAAGVGTAADAGATEPPNATANAPQINTVLRASCRIFAGNARGSGVIFDSDADSYRVLINAHVVGRTGNRVSLEFEHSGYRSGRIPGRVVRSHIARNTSIDLAIVELPRSEFPGQMPVVPLAGVGFKYESPTVLTCGAHGGAAVSLQRGHIVRRTRSLIYYKPEALPGRSGSPLFNESGSHIIGLVAWRTGDGHGLAMNASVVRSFVGGEVAESDNELPEDAFPLWQSSTRLVLVTSAGCQPCELQKRSMPDDVRYETIDIAKANAKGYNIRTTPTLMVFVDGKLEHTTSGLLRGDRLNAFLNRWGFNNSDPQPEEIEPADDDYNPWSNNRRCSRGPVRDRIDNAKDRFAWWLLVKWLGFGAGGIAITLPWFFFVYRTLRKMRSPESEGCPNNRRTSSRKRRSPRKPTQPRRAQKK